MNRVLHHLAGQSQTRLLVYALIQVLLLGVIDYITGPEWFFSIFYTVPVSMMAWFAGRRHGIAASMMAATSWLLADLFAGHVYSNPTIPFWNAGVRLGFFLIITFTLAELRASRMRQDEFNHFIVHDLRSPVSVVVTGLETLRDLSDRELSAQQQELIDLCLASCNRTLTLINSILDLARLESRQMPIEYGPIEIEQLLQSATAPLRLWANLREIRLTWSVAPEIGALQADRVLIERVLINLLSNAVKFSTTRSEVSIRVEPDHASAVTFRVRNQGAGIPPDQMRHIFEKFVQGGAGSTQSGSGLGLSFCKLAVEAQGGRIWAESEVGQWTEFIFTLPLQPPILVSPQT